MASPAGLSVWVSNFFQFLENFTTKKNWRVKLIGFLTVTSLFFASPHHVQFNDPQWGSFEQKREHPLAVLNQYAVGSNMEKKNYRLTIPVIAKIFHLNDLTVYILQYVASMLLLFIALLLAEIITGDQVSGILTTIGLAFIYTGGAGFVDWYAWFDEFAFLFLILAMYSKKPYLIFCWIQLACWVDERAVIASFAVFIWWKLQELTLNDFSLKSFFRIGANSSFTAISVVVYFAVRIAIMLIIHLPSPHSNVGIKTILNDNGFMGIGIWETLEGFWILSIAALMLLYKERKLFLIFLISLFICAAMVSAFSVYDITRSAAYMFPVIFIFLVIIKERFPADDARIILLISSMVCFLFPCYAIIAPKIYWDKPILIRLFFLIKTGGYY